jgi:hypothetical protein
MRWSSCVQLNPGELRLLVTDPERGDVLKASLPAQSNHPRGLLTLLEGLALYQGEKLVTALNVEGYCPAWLGSGLFGDELWPAASPLVQFEVVHRGRRARISGLGDYESLRRIMGER